MIPICLVALVAGNALLNGVALFAKPDRSARHKAGEGRVLQPPLAASIRDGSAAQPLAGSRGAAPSPTCCLQHNSRSILRFSGNGG